jgi:hypothetical protein
MVNYLSEKVKNKVLNSYSHRNVKDAARVSLRLKDHEKNWDDTIRTKISSGGPLLFGRLGGIEAHCIGLHLDRANGVKKPVRFLQSKVFLPRRLRQLQSNAGVYPNDPEIFDFFCSEYLDALGELDIFSVWGKPFAWVESMVLPKEDVIFVSGYGSFPWLEPRDSNSESGWGMALEGKKVLVVSPFIDSIAHQVPHLKKIFKDLEVPKIEFKYLRAPMTQGGLADGGTFRSHLEELRNKMKSIEFDVAMISAGAYSLPLANSAKELGRVGIHAGGAMQIFFGITGQRYDQYPEVTKHFNSYWKRPYLHERPANWKSIEDGCYW